MHGNSNVRLHVLDHYSKYMNNISFNPECENVLQCHCQHLLPALQNPHCDMTQCPIKMRLERLRLKETGGELRSQLLEHLQIGPSPALLQRVASTEKGCLDFSRAGAKKSRPEEIEL